MQTKMVLVVIIPIYISVSMIGGMVCVNNGSDYINTFKQQLFSWVHQNYILYTLAMCFIVPLLTFVFLFWVGIFTLLHKVVDLVILAFRLPQPVLNQQLQDPDV